MVVELGIGEIIRLRKVHPCGGVDWKIFRLGSDIGIQCLNCDRRVLMARHDLERRIKSKLVEK